ncbi:MAG: exo-alpha-sialidase [Pirellulaceae bacterium]
MLLSRSICAAIIAGIALSSVAAAYAEDSPKTPKQPKPYTLWTGEQNPADVNSLPDVPGIVYSLPHELEEGWRFLHGAAVIHYKNQLFVNWAHNPGEENTSTELVRGRRSDDGGKTWGEAEIPAPGFSEDRSRHSHGTFLEHGGKLWCFVANFGEGEPKGTFPGLGTEAFTLNDETNQWDSQGIVARDCWPMDAPVKMSDGNWIMGGLTSKITSCVAISHGDNLTKWETVHINWPEGRGFLETSLIVDDDEITAFIRSEEGAVAISVSKDYGRTWSEVMKANYPMAASQPFADVLSTGQRYLISNIRNRHTLAIAVSKPGEKTLDKVWRVRHGQEPADYAGKVRGGSWAYPYAYEHDGKLYVVYSVRKRECELAIIPISSLVVE